MGILLLQMGKFLRIEKVARIEHLKLSLFPCPGFAVSNLGFLKVNMHQLRAVSLGVPGHADSGPESCVQPIYVSLALVLS